MMSDWHKRLVKAVRDSGLSQADVARASGISTSRISEILAGKKEPGVEKVLKIMRALDLSPTYLFAGYELDEAGEQIMRDLASMDETERQAMMTLLRGRKARG